MDADTDLLARLRKKHPELNRLDKSTTAADIFASIASSKIAALDPSPPKKWLESVVCIPETPSPIFARASSKRERNENLQTDGNAISKRTCQLEDDRAESRSTKLFSKFVSPHKQQLTSDDSAEQPELVSKTENNKKGDGEITLLKSSSDTLTGTRECESDGGVSPTFRRKLFKDSTKVQAAEQRTVEGKQYQKETHLKKAARSNVSRNGYKNAQYGSGYKGWPSDSSSDEDCDDNIPLRAVIKDSKSMGDATERADRKRMDHQKETKNKSFHGPESNFSCNDLNVERYPLDEKEKRKNKNSQKDVKSKKSLFIPRSELFVKNAFNSIDIKNSGQSVDSDRSFQSLNMNTTNARQLSSCRFAKTNVNTANEIASSSDNDCNGLCSPFSMANQDLSHISPTFSTSNQISNTFSISNHISPTCSTTNHVNLTNEPEHVTDLTANQNSGVVQSCPSAQNSGHKRNIRFPSQVFNPAGFINLHPELESSDRPSCMFNSVSGESSVDHNSLRHVMSNTSEDALLLESDNSDGYQRPSCPPGRRTRASSRRKSQASSFRRRGDAVSSQFHHRPDVIHIDDNVEMNNAVSLARQLDNDEEYAKRLQEEMDKEFAMSLHHEAHQGMASAPYTHFDVDGTGLSPSMLPVFQHGMSPVRRRAYNNNRQPNTRSRRRARGSDEDLMLAVDGMGQEHLMLPFHQRDEREESNPLLMMQAHILALLETSQPRRGRRRGVGGRVPRNLIFGFGHMGEGNDYEELLQLAENLGDVKSKGISQTEINRLPTRDYKMPEGQTESEECNICMCEYKEGDRLRILTCFHEFHSKCIDKWLKSSATCPVCRVDVRS